MLNRLLCSCIGLPLMMVLGGCAISVGNVPRNQPAKNWQGKEVPPGARQPYDTAGETTVALSFSGGGTRAAAFAFGALQGLDSLRGGNTQSLLDQLNFITAVSGGSMTAAYYGLHGKAALGSFREAALLRDGEADLRFSLINPLNIARLMSGGLNDRSTLQHWLEDDLFKGATFADMYRRGKPTVWINATNLYNRVAFPFHERAFDALCSDLASYPVSEAVAASMAVPLFFAPIVLEKHPESCQAPLAEWLDGYARGYSDSLLMRSLAQSIHDLRDTSSGRYVKLVDGGITDNYGLASLQQSRLLTGTPYGPLSAKDAVTIKNLLFVVVDAGQSAAGDWNREMKGPSGIDLAVASIDAAIDTNVRMSYDSFVPMMKAWQESITRYRCELPANEQQRIKAANPAWQCDDVSFVVTRISFRDLSSQEADRLNTIPLRLTLPARDVDDLIEAGKKAVLINPTIRAFEARVSN
ncbi:patatin-like phospholipase family protein [Chitinimonas sp.]|uniref:patatin-like phospholipase family protein n=1 Tax=Chitinimonas sp. TaxID=1934313 RepID=UPI0035AE3AD9